jgi:hypothetical protein
MRFFPTQVVRVEYIRSRISAFTSRIRWAAASPVPLGAVERVRLARLTAASLTMGYQFNSPAKASRPSSAMRSGQRPAAGRSAGELPMRTTSILLFPELNTVSRTPTSTRLLGRRSRAARLY